ncbi:MAG TPA: hypothetical protein VFQ65_23895 [Kofleriaceae bacterium]|nr:hypothetical protein [Kofleriaceae bacterium]
MSRLALAISFVLLSTAAHADGVFDVCKGESKRIVTGNGQMSIAFVYPDDFPGRTTREVLYPIGVRLANAEHAKVILVADVDKAMKLVKEKHWKDTQTACGTAPAIESVLGQSHPNLSTARASIACDDKNACQLIIDLERHGRPSAERWVRYVAPLVGSKDSTKVIAAAAPKLVAKGVPPDAPTAGLATTTLTSGTVRTRSDADGALELDRAMEASAAVAACGPKGRKPNDVRGYWADWKLSALGTAMEVMVKPFAGVDKADKEAAECLTKAMRTLQMSCPRDGAVTPVRTAICL